MLCAFCHISSIDGSKFTFVPFVRGLLFMSWGFHQAGEHPCFPLTGWLCNFFKVQHFTVLKVLIVTQTDDFHFLHFWFSLTFFLITIYSLVLDHSSFGGKYLSLLAIFASFWWSKRKPRLFLGWHSIMTAGCAFIPDLYLEQNISVCQQSYWERSLRGFLNSPNQAGLGEPWATIRRKGLLQDVLKYFCF